MKKIIALLIGILISINCWSQKTNLGLNLALGEIYTQNMISDVSIFQNIQGQQVDMNMSVSGKMTYKVTDIQSDVYKMEVRYENLKMTMSFPHGEMEFSSEKNDESDIISTILGKMKDKPFGIKMTKSGKVVEVLDLESVFEGMFDEYSYLNDLQKQQIKDQVTQAYGEKALKGNIEMCSAIFPDTPVAKKDKWNIQTQLESGMSATMETTYELSEVADTYYKISGKSKIETVDKDAYIEANGMPLRYDLAGTMVSDITIDKNTGWTTNAMFSQSMQGTAYIKDNPQMPGGMEIPMTFTTEIFISDN